MMIIIIIIIMIMIIIMIIIIIILLPGPTNMSSNFSVFSKYNSNSWKQFVVFNILSSAFAEHPIHIKVIGPFLLLLFWTIIPNFFNT